MSASEYHASIELTLTYKPCIVAEIVSKACTMYRLCCKVGVLNTCYGAGDLELFTGSFQFEVEGWRSMSAISLREAAKLQAPWNSFTKTGALASQEDATQNAVVVYEITLNVAIIATVDQFVAIKRVKSLLIGRAKELKCVVLMPLYKVILMIHRLAVSFVMTPILHHRMIKYQ